MMLMCEAIYDRADGGVSPHVWWSWHDGLYRITDRGQNGVVDIEFDECQRLLLRPCPGASGEPV
jgi:hypothetical protein